jgi:ABC-type nitrate/sulfonate/bicarbonate transport system permease component
VSARTRRNLQRALGLVIICAAWELLPRLLDISPLVLPPLSAVLGRIGDPLTGDGSILTHAGVTVLESVGAFVIAALVGIAVGTLIGVIPGLRRAAFPLITAAFAIPLITLIPLFLITFGLGLGSKIAFGAFYAFFPIVFNTVAGVSSTEPLHIDLARAYGLSWLRTLGTVVLPGAARQILSGLQIGMAIGTIAVVSTEMFGSVSGLGYLIQRASQGLRAAEVYWLVLVTLAIAYLLLAAVRLLGRAVGVRLEFSAG